MATTCRKTDKGVAEIETRMHRLPPRLRSALIVVDGRRRDAVRRFTDLVGPMGEALAIRMERARHAEELRPLLGMALQVIANTRGRQPATDYQGRFNDL